MSFEQWVFTLPLRIRSLFRRKQIETELDDEMQFHMEQRAAREIGAGESPEVARAIALRAMEGVEQQKEKCRDARHMTFVDNRVRDIRYAFRTFRLSPGFTAATIVTLALGIGANTAIFSLVETVMLKLLPVKAPGELYLIGQKWRGQITSSWSYPDYRAMREHNTRFDGVICYGAYPEPMGLQRNGGLDELAHGIFVSGNYFKVLGVPAALGHLFTRVDDRAPGAAPYIILSYAYWQSHFNHDPSVIGQTLRINAYPLNVIGVASRGFYGADVAFRPDFFIPLMMRGQVMHEEVERWNTRHTHWLAVLGRLKAGTGLPAAEGELLAIGKSQDERERRSLADPRWANTTEAISLVPAARGYSYFADELKKPLRILFLIVALVLAIACANVAGLMTAREASRHREIAVRLAIGASRGRLLAQLFTETMLLATIGGLLGSLLSLAGAHALQRFTPQPGFAPVNGIDAALDWRVFGFTALVCVATGLLFGMAPAWLSTRIDPGGSLKDKAAGSVRWGRMNARRASLILQVAFSVPLLFAAGLFVHTLANLRYVDIGLAHQNVYVSSVDPTLFGYKGQRLRNFYDSLCQRVATLPGVSSASLAEITPLSGSSWNDSVTVEGYTPKTHEDTVYFDAVGPEYFETVGTPILSGRGFTEGDNPPQAIELPEHLGPGDKIPDGDGRRVAIVNEAFARHYFGKRRPLGGQVAMGTGPRAKDFYEVVGVVKDTRYFSVREAAPPMVFVPVWRRFASGRSLVIRTSGTSNQLETALNREIHRLDPAVPLLNIRTLAHDIDQNILVERMLASLSAFFGVLALLLCVVGLYGVVAYTVTRRTREIGIRIAIGSPAISVMWLVTREVIMLIFAGTALGATASFFAAHLIASVLFGVHVNDPLSLFIAGISLAAAATLASFFPARRAMRVDPMQALRYE